VLVVLFNALSGFVGHLIVGHFDLVLLLFLGSGSTIGGFFGPRILARINVQALEKVYGLLQSMTSRKVALITSAR
jgi:uncharacterized membrane protein YfcA